MILAAGLGTRLRPITDTIPKPLVPVVGIPNIVRTILHLEKLGIRQVVINVHHLGDALMETLGDGSAFGVDIEYSIEEVLLGTGGGVKKALPLLGDDPFLVVNGDALFAPDFRQIVAKHRERGGLATMILREDENAEAFGAVGLNQEGRVVRLVYAGDESLAVDHYMFTGCQVLHPDIGERLPDNGCIVRQTYIPMMEQGLAVYGHVDRTCFFDLGTPQRLLTANTALLSGETTIDGFESPGPYFIDGGADVDNGACIEAGAVVCAWARVDAGVRVARCLVMPGARVRQSVEGAIVFGENVIRVEE